MENKQHRGHRNKVETIYTTEAQKISVFQCPDVTSGFSDSVLQGKYLEVNYE